MCTCVPFIIARTHWQHRLYADLVNDALTEFSYDASLAGLHYSFKGGQSGLIVTMNGYNDKMLVLAKDVFDTIKRLVVNPERLEVFKHQVHDMHLEYCLRR